MNGCKCDIIGDPKYGIAGLKIKYCREHSSVMKYKRAIHRAIELCAYKAYSKARKILENAITREKAEVK